MVFSHVSMALIFILLDFLERQLLFHIQNAFSKNILFRIFKKKITAYTNTIALSFLEDLVKTTGKCKRNCSNLVSPKDPN